MSATFLPELREVDATGDIGRIYADVRRLGGVPMVALIFRHLATLPGALEWMWAALGPAWRNGHVQEAAWRVAREVPLAPLACMRGPALTALGVDDAALGEISAVLGAYNRANPENLLTVLCILRLLEGTTASASASPREWNPPPPHGPLPPMVEPAKFSREVADILDLVAAPGAPGSPRVVQSLYRHFAHRPQFLALAVTLLRQRFDDGSIDRGTAAIHDAMSRAADAIMRGITAPAAPHEGIRPVCERFGGAVIPQMIVVGRLLEEALP